MKMTYEQFKQANYEMVVKQIQNTLKNRAFRETGKLVYNEDIEKDVKNTSSGKSSLTLSNT